MQQRFQLAEGQPAAVEVDHQRGGRQANGGGRDAAERPHRGVVVLVGARVQVDEQRAERAPAVGRVAHLEGARVGVPRRLRRCREGDAEQPPGEAENEIQAGLGREVRAKSFRVDLEARPAHALAVERHVPAVEPDGFGRRAEVRGLGLAQHGQVGALEAGHRGLHAGQERLHFGGASGHAVAQHVVGPGFVAEQARVVAAAFDQLRQRLQIGVAAAVVEGPPQALAGDGGFGALEHRLHGRIVEAEQHAAVGVARGIFPHRLGNAAQLVDRERHARAVLAQAAAEILAEAADLGVELARAVAAGGRQGDAGVVELVELMADEGAVDIVGRRDGLQHGVHGGVLAESAVEGVGGPVAGFRGVAQRLVGVHGDQHRQRAHRVLGAALQGVEGGKHFGAGAGAGVATSAGRHRRQPGLAALQVVEHRPAGVVDLRGGGVDGKDERRLGELGGCRTQHGNRDSQRPPQRGDPHQNAASSIVRQVSSRVSTGASQAAMRGSS